MNTKDWTNDQSITLECKDKGKKERIISSILIKLNLSSTHVYLHIFFFIVGYCIDEDLQCEDWASVGECEVNSRYMLIKCRKSCNVCGNI